MRSFRKLLTTSTLIAAVVVAGVSLHRRSQAGEPVDVRKAADDAKAQAAATEAPAPEKNGKGGKNGSKAADKENERMHDIPVSPEHPAKGLKIPYFDNEGKLQMIFVIGVATRLDADHIDMANMQVETFDEQGQHEMDIDLPKSVLDLNTSVISTKKHVTIKREDFVLTGETMEFNTKTKQGSLGGSVRMLIYNLANPAEKPAPETPAPPQSAASATPQPASAPKVP